MINPSGNVFYKDHYDTIYHVEWNTVGTVIDFTTITMQPYVWGKPSSGYVLNGILFRRGIITVQRQVIRLLTGGYEIVAEGSSQYEDFIQMNFPCATGPVDNFKYHLNCSTVDEIHVKISEGPHWADPDDPDDADAIWGDLNPDGSPIDITVTGVADILEWTDVWSN